MEYLKAKYTKDEEKLDAANIRIALYENLISKYELVRLDMCGKNVFEVQEEMTLQLNDALSPYFTATQIACFISREPVRNGPMIA